MIRSSAVLVAAAIGVLVAGVIAGSLQVVYLSIGVSVLAGVLLAVGVLLRRGEVFGGSGAASPGEQPAWPPGDTAEVPVMAAGTAMSGRPGDRARGWPPGPARPAAVGPDVSARPGGRAPGRAGPAKTGPARGGRPGGYAGTHGAGRGRPPSPGKRGPADQSWPGHPARPDRSPRADSPGRPDGAWRAGTPERPDAPPPSSPPAGRRRPARPGPAPVGQEHPREPGADRPSDGAVHRGPPGSGPSGYGDFWDRVSDELADGKDRDTGGPAWEATAGPRAMGGQRPGPADSQAPRPDTDDAAGTFSTTGPPEQADHPDAVAPEPARPGRGRDDETAAGPWPRWGLVVPRFAGGEPRGDRASEAEDVPRDAEAKAAALREGTGAGAGVAEAAAGEVAGDAGAGGVSADAKAGAMAGAGATAKAEAGAEGGAADGGQRGAGDDRPQQRDGAGAGGQPAAGGDPLDDQVMIVQGITRYHRRGCILIRFLGDDDLESMTRREAVAANCVPCKACQPDKPPADG